MFDRSAASIRLLVVLAACTAPATEGGLDPAPVVTSLQMSPDTATLQPGDSLVLAVHAQLSDGSTSTVPVGWSASGGTISAGTVYHAGATPGQYLVIASTSQFQHADTTRVTIADTTTAPTLSSVRITPDSATLDPGATASFAAQGQWSDGSLRPVNVTWTGTGGSISSGGVYQAGSVPGTFHVVATTPPNLADTALVTVRDTTTPPAGGTVLLTEGFEDASVSGRGWYDNTAPAVTAVEHHGGTGALEMAFAAGGTKPVKGGALRHKFTATDRVYLRYWVKYSSNWVGSGVAYHPHEFHFTTNLDGDWVGPSATHLTTYVEHTYQNGGIPRLAIQDALDIDSTKINVDLTSLTEQRAAAGCNGNPDGYATNCYQSNGQWFNEKGWKAAQPAFTPGPGPGYKNAWHKVEAYFQLNSIQNGKALNDGVAQYWFDGQLLIDHQNVQLRTGANPTMKFIQFLIAPYIGVGSPVAQTMWVDDVVVATGRVP
jgi:hypothetical protein